jgi:excinuclease ABC subunit A
VVAEGTPEEVADHPESHTGAFLKPLLEGQLRTTRQPAAGTRKAGSRTAARKTATPATKKAAAKRTPAPRGSSKRAAAGR